jgi:hypothetical protein
MHGENVALDGQVDRVGVAAGQVEQDDELVALAVGVDRHRCRPSRGAEHLLGHSVEFTERIGAHQHAQHSSQIT